ncbi:MAG: sirohydrochlorin cobaltochelatase [Eubacterium sp.]|nr:sirohydrochlorin cobaltochelatase [Eubacterium sp.]
MPVESTKAILVTSFGTSVNETRKKTIDAIVKDMAEAFPDRKVYTAWSSSMLIRILAKRDGAHIDTVEEAFGRMKTDGIRDVIVQPTHIINGYDNDKLVRQTEAHLGDFDTVRVGRPMVSGQEDNEQVVENLKNIYGRLPEDEALVLLGHGTSHYANNVYPALDFLLKDDDCPNFYIGTVEGYPDYPCVLKSLKRKKYRKITLAPFLIVAGVHALDDMAGEDPGSWKSSLEAEGFRVECIFRGIGEYPLFRQMLVEHAENAKPLTQS